MKQRKPNIKAWYSLALVMLLFIGLLAVATGTTLARYRDEKEKKLTFQVRQPEQIQLGTLKTEEVESEGETPVTREVFVPAAQLAWVQEKNVTQLKFAIANGISGTDHSTRDQKVHLRFIASVGVWNGTQTPVLSLILPLEEGETEPKTVTATVEPLVEGTALYHTHGQGWLYTFLDQNEEELFWELAGGELSYVSLTVTIDEAVPNDPSLLQPYVLAEVIPE